MHTKHLPCQTLYAINEEKSTTFTNKVHKSEFFLKKVLTTFFSNDIVWVVQKSEPKNSENIFFIIKVYKSELGKEWTDMYNTYEDFANDMLDRGFSWDEIEYYWRNPDEFDELFD